MESEETMSWNAEIQNTAESKDDACPEDIWTERRIQTFLANRTPETWLNGLLGLAFALLILVRLHPNLLNSFSG